MNEKIFISYSRKDKDKVFALRDKIESATHQKCWIDLNGIESDQQFEDIIIRAINNAEIFLFMYSVNSAESKWTKSELRFADKKKKKIVFVNIDGGDLDDWFTFKYSGHDIIDISNNDQTAKMLKNLSDWCCEDKSSISTMPSSNAYNSLKIKPNKDCQVLIDEEFRGIAKENAITKFPLPNGEYCLACISVDTNERLDMDDFEIKDADILRKPEFKITSASSDSVKAKKKFMEFVNACDTCNQEPVPDIEKPFLMPVEDVFSIKNIGTVVTGRIETGVINVGEEVQLIGLGKDNKSVVRGVEMFRKLVARGEAGDNVGLLLRGINREDVERGMVLAHPGAITPHQRFKASIYVLKKEEGGRHTPLKNHYRPQFYLRTMDCTGEISLPEGIDMVMPGENIEIKVELIYPVAINVGLRFFIRKGGRPVGFGQITEVLD